MCISCYFQFPNGFSRKQEKWFKTLSLSFNSLTDSHTTRGSRGGEAKEAFNSLTDSHFLDSTNFYKTYIDFQFPNGFSLNMRYLQIQNFTYQPFNSLTDSHQSLTSEPHTRKGKSSFNSLTDSHEFLNGYYIST